MAFLKCAVVGMICAVNETSGYPAIGTYMPVSDVLEHSQIHFDIAAFNDKLAGGSPDYVGAKSIYTNGGGNSCKSATTPRTLQGFAAKNLSGESFADAFYTSDNPKGFWDLWLMAALDGTGEFEGLSRTKRVTSLKKGALGVVTFYASHELEAAITKAAEISTRSDSGSGHAWDEGWAFYHGVDGSNSPWEVAGKRDANFPMGTKVQVAIVQHFNKGLVSVRSDTYNDVDATIARDTIYKMWAITYLRAALKYLEISERSYSEKAHTEGYAYYKAIDGWVASKDAAAAQKMRDALAITQTSISAGTYCAAKAAIETAYPALGIDCTMMGEWTDANANVTTCSTPCVVAIVSFPDGADAVASVDASNAADKIACQARDSDGDLDFASHITGHVVLLLVAVMHMVLIHH